MRFQINRRDWLRISGLAALGGIPVASTATTSRSSFPGFGKAKSVLIVFTGGGMSQFETWDPKPLAPAEIRGAFQSIPTRVSGLRFGEHMPNIANRADRFAVLRSMTHDDLDHGSAIYAALTGQFHPRKSSNPLPSPNDFPTSAAVLKRIRPNRRFPHTAIHLNGPLLAPLLPSVGQNGGFLGRAYDPLVLGDVTDTETWFRDMEPRVDLPPERLEERQGLLRSIDAAAHRSEANAFRQGARYVHPAGL